MSGSQGENGGKIWQKGLREIESRLGGGLESGLGKFFEKNWFGDNIGVQIFWG